MDILCKHAGVRFAAIVLILSALGAVLVAQRPRSLIVNGKSVGQALLLVRGRTYVDVEMLAQALDGSVTLQPDRVVLTLPGVEGGDANASQPETMSREFASTALGAVALMREWRVAIETMISQQLPIAGTYFQDFQDRAVEGMRQAGVVAANSQDQQAYQLLQTGFSLQAKWAGNAIATRQALDATRTMSPDVLKNDVELQKISDCSKSLGPMLAIRRYADIPTCH